MTLDSLRFKVIRWRALAIGAGLAVGTALVAPVLLATSAIIGTADGGGTIAGGEYAGQLYTVHLAAEYSGIGSTTLTTGVGTVVEIGAERFVGIVDPAFPSLCCGEGRLGTEFGVDFFSMTGYVRHVTAAVPHDHLFGARASVDGRLCITILDQTGTIVTPTDPPHDPGIGLVCDLDATVTIEEAVLTVAIDIKPGTVPNTINPHSHGVIPVAILSTEDFDATTVDPLSVRFGPGGAAEAHGRGHVSDVNGDGRPDLVLHFDTQATGIVSGSTSASLAGTTFDGEPIQGTDDIVTVGG